MSFVFAEQAHCTLKHNFSPKKQFHEVAKICPQKITAFECVEGPVDAAMDKGLYLSVFEVYKSNRADLVSQVVSSRGAVMMIVTQAKFVSHHN